MNKKIFKYCAAFFPLVAVNGFCLASNYFENGNVQVNITVAVLFLVVSMLITVTKLFFDFFMAVVTLRCTAQELPSGGILDRLVCNMLPQWGVTLGALVLGRLIFPGCSAQVDLVTFAVAHTVYYAATALELNRMTGRKLYSGVYGSAAMVCWGYMIYSLMSMAA